MITNKDGTPYSLRGPNPIMSGQNIWDDAVFHNMDRYEEISYIPKSWKSNEEKIVQEVSPSAKVTLELDDRIKFKCWILPTEFKTTVDEVYGQEYRRLVWGKKFSTEIYFEKVGEVYATFWTDAIKSINRGSIIFVEMKYWKVESYVSDDTGIFISCSISDQTPSFA